jgi:hypothetical protein
LGFEDAGGNQGQSPIPLAAGFGLQNRVEAQVANGSENRSDVTMRQRACDLKCRRKLGTGLIAAFQQLTQGLDFLRRPVAEIGEGAVVDLTLFPEAFAQEDGRGRVSVGHRGHIHVDRIQVLSRTIKRNIPIYMTTQLKPKSRKTIKEKGSTCDERWNFGLRAIWSRRAHSWDKQKPR